MEMVGAVVGRGAAGYSGSTLRFNVEFMTAGPNNIGNNVGGWDGQVTGFVAAAGRPYGPGVQLTFISVDGGAQYESPVEIQLFSGNWWIAHNGNWLGYYPGSFFNLIPSAGCRADWYGEVYDPTPTTWTNTNMGQGYYASAGFTYASFFREPYYYDAGGVSRWPDSTWTTNPVDPQCYATSAMFSGTSPWGRFFYLGGPGNEASNSCR